MWRTLGSQFIGSKKLWGKDVFAEILVSCEIRVNLSLDNNVLLVFLNQ
ncbi:hypothetical protein VCRA2113O324_190018 [Vibrio crassostreae]|nr:hypothetical protein VCRA2111O320_190018 [Vibrio crassostreae]CAK1829508.1 hypothetical protein VCRA2113O324_190018 [Vibrio crassostreae]CAK2707488.1 hypothetical protein VCRA2121O336_190089 [Vibrio crassostreae]CAK3191636.1 hypothetical protein VCRA2120O329_180018 [Vibrio crassostreae]CAK3855032.1 hypothetical protein VCRA2128O347_220018 [Vibrio crassostreae]